MEWKNKHRNVQEVGSMENIEKNTDRNFSWTVWSDVRLETFNTKFNVTQ